MTKPVGPYTPVMRVGDWVICSGQIALVDGAITGDTVGAQVTQALANMAGLLESEGVSLSDVVKTTVFLIDPRDYAEMDAAYRARFSDPLPAREAVFVAGLPKQARVEISAIACD